MSRRNFTCLIVAVAVALVCASRVERNPYARYVSDGYRLIEQYALAPPSDDALFTAAMQGMVSALRRGGDEHSDFLPQDQADPLRDELSQSFGGLGLPFKLVGQPSRAYVIAPPIPGSPAAQAGMRIGDRIDEVNGVPIAGMSQHEVTQTLSGEIGKPVRLTLARHGEATPLQLVITRALLPIESLAGLRKNAEGTWDYFTEQSPDVAYVQLLGFGDRTLGDLRSLLTKLKSQGMQRLILDLRGNPGGTVDSAVAASELFLPAGAKVVETRGRNGAVLASYETEHRGEWADLPLVVLIDRETASASEIMAAALKENGRATVVGERSFGKGSVQRTIDLEAGRSMLKVTWATFCGPSGNKIHRMPTDGPDDVWGVHPDVGFDAPLSAQQYAAFVRLPETRRLLEPIRAAIAAGTAPEEIAIEPLDFSDNALQLAIDHLLGSDGKSAESAAPLKQAAGS
ncbi:putative CtpA-like serine protease [Pirellulimonas nuda]|uniref:Putative CtpA-like serine protease n=1 Tax=Pirellulimonas nuda TaxID=2528009 RepID=A0A518DH47_9BACT|nr:S41 family peptidase [Pirellulimonas nuda]QDU90797.1 putative CtpA-like serine protease [Pirellulimonas nuda]